MKPGLVRLCGAAGLCASLLLPAVMTGLTVREHEFLATAGWSPIGRTATQWPSLLAIGPDGWLMSTAFAVSAMLVGAQAWGFWVSSCDGRGRFVGALIGVGALGLAGVTFPADLPNVTSSSWHATVHNLMYPLIPLGTVVAAALCGYGRPQGVCPRLAHTSRVMAPLMGVAIGATAIDGVAQLSRYFAFALFAGWLAMVGADLSRFAGRFVFALD